MIKDLLMQSKWRVFNVSIAKKIGLHETLILMELADAEAYFNNEWFFLTYEQISENTTLSEYQIRKVVKSLKAQGLIKVKMMGLPAKQHYKLMLTSIANFKGQDPPETRGSIPLENGGAIGLETRGSIYKQPINKKPIIKKERVEFPIAANPNRVINFPFASKKFYDAWEQWKEYKRLEHKFNYKSPQSEQAALMDLNTKAQQNENIALEIIMQSIANGWKGFFNLKNETNGKDQTATAVGNLISKLQS